MAVLNNFPFDLSNVNIVEIEKQEQKLIKAEEKKETPIKKEEKSKEVKQDAEESQVPMEVEGIAQRDNN